MRYEMAIKAAQKYAKHLNAPVVVYSFRDEPQDFGYVSARFFHVNFSERWTFEQRKIYLIETSGEIKTI